MAFAKSRANALSTKLRLDTVICARGYVDASYIAARAVHVQKLTLLNDISTHNAL